MQSEHIYFSSAFFWQQQHQLHSYLGGSGLGWLNMNYMTYYTILFFFIRFLYSSYYGLNLSGIYSAFIVVSKGSLY